MITEKRYDLILQELNKKDFLSLQELINRIGCSASTIRRDLSKLQQMGKLQRVHGGATIVHNRVLEPILSDKLATNLTEKKEIAQYAAALIQDRECIFLDAGSSTIEMIPFITAKDIVVVTNGLTHVEKLLAKGIKTLMVGGEVKDTTLATVGASALEIVRRYCFDKAFLGMNGIDLKHGLTTPDEKEALIKEMAIQRSNESFVLVDHSKFKQVYFARINDDDANVTILTSKEALTEPSLAQFQERYHILGGLS